MTAKEYLKQYEYATKRAEKFHEEYKREMLLVDAIRSTTDNDGMPHGSGISKPTEEKALRLAKEYADKKNVSLITINSWNEWTETSYLEPDSKNGYGYLEAVKKVFK